MWCDSSGGDSSGGDSSGGDSSGGDSSDTLFKTEDSLNGPTRWLIRHPGSGCFQAFSPSKHWNVKDIPSQQSQVLKEHFRLLLGIPKKRSKARMVIGKQTSRKSTVPQAVKPNCGPCHQHRRSQEGVENAGRTLTNKNMKTDEAGRCSAAERD
ncbi:hypothetical protein SRHO_G00139650 [Serrasalmus rhombeus]